MSAASTPRRSVLCTYWPLGLALLAALLHGVVYLAIMPPWQHYDEPNHFEVAWWVANYGRFPQRGENDPAFTRALLGSMVQNDFYTGMGFTPDLDDPGLRIPGYDQYDEPPLYYYLAAAPLKLVSSASLETQLSAARLASLLLFLLTILAAWGVAGELFPHIPWMRWLLPLSIALLPAFADIMTAVNNDAAAIAVASFFIWGSVRLVRRGLSVLDGAWVLAAAALAWFAKSTAFIALLVLPLVFLFAALRGRWRRWAWGVLLLGLLLAPLALLRWGDAASWHRATHQPAATRQFSDQAVLGKSVLVLSGRYPNPQNWLAEVSQLLPEESSARMRGQMITLGVWMWASQPVQANLPWIVSNFPPLQHVVQLDTEPRFFAYQLEIPADALHIWIALTPPLTPGQNVIFYYDGFIMAAGARPLDEMPRFTTPDGVRGEWGGQPFENLIRNPSFETAGPRIYPPLDNLGARLLPNQTLPSMLVSALLDWRATGFYYRLSADLLVQRFWAVFGWAHIKLTPDTLYTWLSAFTLVGLAGAALGLVRRRRRLPWELVLILALMAAATWGIALVRGTIYLFHARLYYTVARHAYPVIIPTMLALLLGWREIVLLLRQGLQALGNRAGIVSSFAAFLRTERAARAGLALWLLIFLALDLYAIWGILAFYASSP